MEKLNYFYKLHFDNEDIIITDPCYLVDDDKDWVKCDCGMTMKNLGFTNCFTRNTMYGDWICDTIDTNTKEVIGHFCADSGMVGVFTLNEVLKYNPNCKDLSEYVATTIKNFTGDVYFVIETSSELDFELHIVGYGNVNFRTEQVGA